MNKLFPIVLALLCFGCKQNNVEIDALKEEVSQLKKAFSDLRPATEDKLSKEGKIKAEEQDEIETIIISPTEILEQQKPLKPAISAPKDDEFFKEEIEFQDTDFDSWDDWDTSDTSSGSNIKMQNSVDTIKVKFENVYGLEKGTEIIFLGLVIGKVEDIGTRTPKNGWIVSLGIEERYFDMLYADIQFSIKPPLVEGNYWVQAYRPEGSTAKNKLRRGQIVEGFPLLD